MATVTNMVCAEWRSYGIQRSDRGFQVRPLLKSEGLFASQLHWVNRTPITEVMTCTVKTVTVEPIFLVQSSQLMMITLRVIFDEPQIAVTPGRSFMFYQDDMSWWWYHRKTHLIESRRTTNDRKQLGVTTWLIRLYDRTIAFSLEICQAVALVQQVKKDGRCDKDAFEASRLNAILNTNPANTVGVFGREANLKLGLECLVKGIDSTPAGSDITRYIISWWRLNVNYLLAADSMSRLGDRIQTAGVKLSSSICLMSQMISNLRRHLLRCSEPLWSSYSLGFWVRQQYFSRHQANIRFVPAVIRHSKRCFVAASSWRRRRHLIFGRKMIEAGSNPASSHVIY